MTELKPLLEYPTVQAWMEGLRQHWGGDPATDDPDRLAALEAFCRFAGKDPDMIVSECVIERDGEKRIRAKGRQRYVDLIAEFQSNVEGSRLKRRKWGNAVRSFLIHNGILLQSGLQAGEGGDPDG